MLNGFRNVKKTGAGWSATCPAHDDRKASLSIGLGDAGRWLLKCHAGCELDDILAAAHLEHSDLFPEQARIHTSTIAATYRYFDEGGRHLYNVHRYEPKDFRQQRADGVWKMTGVRRVLYHLPDLQGKTIAYIVEGEKDADRLQSLGLPGTTNAGGAGKWREEYTRQLKAASVESVVVLPDNDDPGRTHADAVARSCAAAGLAVKLVTLPDGAKDVSAWFDAGATRDALVALVKATPLHVPAEAPTDMTAADTLDLVTLADVTPEDISWIWPGRLARGKYTLLAGDPGLGKSTVQLAIAAHLSRGSAWPDGGQAPQGKTLILSAEDGIADTIRPRLDRLGGDPSHVVVLRAVRDERGARPLNLARDLDRLADAIARVRPLVVGIDPITAYLGKTDTYKDAEMRGLLAPLLALLEQERVALLAVGHLSKSDQRAALHRPGGSIAFVAAARIAVCLAPDPNDADRRVLAGLKSNLGPLPASLAFRLPDGRLEWETRPADLDAEALLRPQAPHDRDEHTDAERVVRDLLADPSAWPLEARHAIEAGGAHGIHERTLQRTAKRLGVRISRLGFGPGGKWLWHYPVIPVIPDSPAPLSVPASSMAPMRDQAVIDDIPHIDDNNTCTSREDHDERI
jgi:putative DNA primase/helicase